MKRRFYVLMSLMLLAGCEPERGIRNSKDFVSEVNVACIERALHATFGNVYRGSYVSSGHGFPQGTTVTQFTYYRSTDWAALATLDIGGFGGGTRIIHSFTGAGNELPQADFPPALKAMGVATAALRVRCDVDLSGLGWQEIGQSVDALN